MATESDEADFFRNCPPSRCSSDGPDIKFPFRLESSSSSCGAPGMQLSCSGQDTLLLHHVLGLSKVTGIDYIYGVINIVPLAESWSQCALQKIISANYSTSVYKQYGFQYASLVSCSEEFIWDSADSIFGPISCLSNASQSLYLYFHLLLIFFLFPSTLEFDLTYFLILVMGYILCHVVLAEHLINTFVGLESHNPANCLDNCMPLMSYVQLQVQA